MPLQSRQAPPAPIDNLAEKQVLIVDRHPAVVSILRQTLGQMGINTIIDVGKANEAIAQLRETAFDIIFSDFLLDDGCDGQQLLEALRHEHLISPATVYIVTSGERSYSNVVGLAELGPDDYLIKPLTPNNVSQRLLRCLQRKAVLHPIYQHAEAGALQDAILACDQVARTQPDYVFDAFRLKGEYLLALGEHAAAEKLYERVIQSRNPPWAKMGLAKALCNQGAGDLAIEITENIIAETPQYIAAYDFLAAIHDTRLAPGDALKALQRGALASPHNTLRQRLVGDHALRNHDLLSAEKAYGKVLDRSRGSALACVDDFANLARVQIERGHVDSARHLIAEMKRTWRAEGEGELAGLVLESLCLNAEGLPAKAAAIANKAEQLHATLHEQSKKTGKALSQRLSIDLAQVCYVLGQDDAADGIMRQVAAENPDDPHLLGQINRVFDKAGRSESGKALLAAVDRELIEINNRGVRAARDGDLRGAVELLTVAVEKVPSMAFLLNAAKAIFTLLEQEGWDNELAERGKNYLARAGSKNRQHPGLAAARELAIRVQRKHQISSKASPENT